MKAVLLLLTLALIATTPLLGQTPGPGRSRLEFLLLGRFGGAGALAGAQAEYTGFRHLAPWVSTRYGVQNNACTSALPIDCTIRGLSALAGARLIVGRWGRAEPYLTLGLGMLRWDDGDTEMTGTAQVGLAWLAFGRVRPRIEFGYEGHINPGVTAAVGVGL